MPAPRLPKTVQSKVLIADNDLAVSSLLAEMVRRLGCSVELAHDGEAAMAALATGDFRVLVCDLDMPRASGFEVVRSVAHRPDAPKTLVISGFIDTGTEQRLLAFACVHMVLKKPFDLLLFSNHVRDLLPAVAPTCEDVG